MLIRNYGLFWRRDDVHWGVPNNSGHLLGTRAKRLESEEVDFRLQRGVYVLYDDAFRLVYVGQAGAGENQRLFIRLRQHTRDALADRWSKFSWFGIQRVLQNGVLAVEAAGAHTDVNFLLDHIEAILISSAEPPLNRKGGRFGDEVDQYLQYRDEQNLGLTIQEMTKEVWKGIKHLTSKKIKQ